jgi:hypothetical protein
MAREPPKPSDPEWAAYHAPFTLHEAESHPGTWVVRTKDDMVVDQGPNKLMAQLLVDMWNDDAARWWMQSP